MKERHSLNVEFPRKRTAVRFRPEQQLHISLVDLLKVILPRNAFVMHYPAGGSRSPAEAGILKRMATLAGVPDLIIGYNERAYGIELKTDKTDLSIDQRNTHAIMRACGWRVEVARSIDEAVRCLDEFGIPLRLAEDDAMLIRARRAA